MPSDERNFEWLIVNRESRISLPCYHRGLWARRLLTTIKNEQTKRECCVRANGADRQWVEVPPRQLSVSLVADKRLGLVTGRAEAL
jgi:hypothetical protein